LTWANKWVTHVFYLTRWCLHCF